MRLTIFDRWGGQKGVVNDVIEAVHKDELNGEDSLTLVLASCSLSKGDRIVWRDSFLGWHEHVVSDLKDVHLDGKLYTTAYCENSMVELFTDYIEDLRPHGVSATVALQRALSTSRWEVGMCDVTGSASATFYHTSAREALSLVVKNWGGELSAGIDVSGTHVTARKVNLNTRGQDCGKRFEWSKDLVEISREVATDDVCTALYGYGKGLECYDDDGESTGGYGRKLTFGEINGGLDYVADDDARLLWGLPDGSGGIKHAFGKVEFDDCEDEAELLRLTQAELASRCHPRLTYTANVLDLADAGFSSEDVRTGDVVAIIDRELGERLSGRVLCVERYLLNEQSTVITLGNLSRSISSVISGTQAQVDWMKGHVGGWDGAASISTNYINGIINNLNGTMNQTGGYTYLKPGDGIITYDRPEDQNPTMAIEIKGAGFRIANSKNSGGTWNWRTFGTGDGFTADEINAGILRGGACWLNLNDGTFLFGDDGSFVNFGTDGRLVINADDVTIQGGALASSSELAEYEESTDEWKALAESDIESRVAKGTVSVQLSSETGTVTISGSRLVIESAFMSLNSGGHMTVYGAVDSEGTHQSADGLQIYACTQMYKGGLYFWNNSLSTSECAVGIRQRSDSPTLSITSPLSVTGGSIQMAGSLSVLGTKSRQVTTNGYGDVLMAALESPTPCFCDFGTAICGDDGCCAVDIDPVFAETVADGHEYRVLASASSPGGAWVDKSPTCFTVHAAPGSHVDYIVIAPQRGYDTVRFDCAPPVEQAQDAPCDWIFEGEEALAAEALAYYEASERSYEEL